MMSELPAMEEIICKGLIFIAKNYGLHRAWLGHLMGHAVAAAVAANGRGERTGTGRWVHPRRTTAESPNRGSWGSNTKLQQLRSSCDGSLQWLLNTTSYRPVQTQFVVGGSPAASGDPGEPSAGGLLQRPARRWLNRRIPSSGAARGRHEGTTRGAERRRLPPSTRRRSSPSHRRHAPPPRPTPPRT
jgi:hypothetical protein